jgi:V/A-type H+-transporting ATPase subunit E
MNDRLQELTDKIYKEGITKGEEEATRIKAAAKEEADQILAKARNEADQIIVAANKKAAEIRENTNSEIKLAARQAIDALKFAIVNLVNGSITSPEIKAGMSDIRFILKAIETVIKNWAASTEADPDMKILIPEKDEKKITAYFSSVTKGILDKRFSIGTVNGLKTGFQVAPDKGGYKISFTDQDFINFFQAFLRPKVVDLLFDKNE